MDSKASSTWTDIDTAYCAGGVFDDAEDDTGSKFLLRSTIANRKRFERDDSISIQIDVNDTDQSKLQSPPLKRQRFKQFQQSQHHCPGQFDDNDESISSQQLIVSHYHPCLSEDIASVSTNKSSHNESIEKSINDTKKAKNYLEMIPPDNRLMSPRPSLSSLASEKAVAIKAVEKEDEPGVINKVVLEKKKNNYNNAEHFLDDRTKGIIRDCDRNDDDGNQKGLSIENIYSKNIKMDNIKSLSSSSFKFDEWKFFSSPSFQPGTKEEAFRRIYAAIEQPVKELEKDGYEAFKQYLDDCADVGDGRSMNYCNNGRVNLLRRLKRFDTNNNRIKKREESIRKSLKDAFVNGDPREYQRMIFEVAKKRNTIVNLGTGSGKTLIALLLIREVWSSTNMVDSEKIQDGKEKKGLAYNGDGSNSISAGEKIVDNKQTLFLVPSVALAIQQSLTLRANLPRLHVETACYASASSKRARASLGRCEIIVATHGAIQDLLMHYGDTFSMDRFNLVVIDECHYAASGNHTYRHLMKKFYHPLEIGKRPRILGLTASPLLNVKETHSDEQLETMINSLESNLDSKMVSAAGLVLVKEDVTGITTTNDILNRVIDEKSLDVRGAHINRSIPSADNLDLLPSRHREFKQLEHLFKNVGPLVLSIYCAVLRRELSKNIFENESNHQFDRSVSHLRRIEKFCDQEIKNLPNNGRNDKLLLLESLVENLIEEKGGMQTIGLIFVERRITALALHCYFQWRNKQIAKGASNGNWVFARQAQLQKCESDAFFFDIKSSNIDSSSEGDERFDDSIDDPMYLFQHRKETQKRNSGINGAETLDNDLDLCRPQFMDAESDSENERQKTNEKIPNYDYLKSCSRTMIKSTALVRNPVQIFNSLSLTQKKMRESEKTELAKNWIHKESNVREVLSKLRRGDFNLMFATSVMEEGVDVQACSFVVVFDGLTSIKSYIQMKGRARKQDAKFFVFGDPQEDRRSKLDLRVAQKMERRIQNIIEQRMGVHAPTIQVFPSCNEQNQSKAFSKELAAVEAGAYRVGDATVDLQSSKSLLNRYFLSIPLDPFVRCKKESLLAYMPCFENNKLALPIHLPSDIRNVILPSKYNKLPRREQQKILSLMACVRLQCYGLLNERLLPLNRKDMQSRVLKVATQKLEKIETQSINLDNFYATNSRHLMVYPIRQKSITLTDYYVKLKGRGHSLGLITTTPIDKLLPPFLLHHAEFGEISISIGEPSCITCSGDEFSMLQDIFLLLLNERWCRRSRNTFYETRKKDQYKAVTRPYLVGVLSAEEVLDWDLMKLLLAESKRSKEERILATRKASPFGRLPEPRIWRPSYNEHINYVVFGPSGINCGEQVTYEKEGVNTYCDYYKQTYSLEFLEECPLFHSQRMWFLPSGLPTKSNSVVSSESNDNSFVTVDIPQHAFFEDTLANAHIASLSVFLPQILFLFERHQKTEAFIKHCEIHIPTLGNCLKKMNFKDVEIAITSKSGNPEENYDKWEWIGDAVLKLLQTDSLLKSPRFKHFIRFLHEGDLSMLRSSMGTNERLKQICNHLNLEHFIMMTSLSRGKWIPSPLQKTETSQSKSGDGVGRMKILADVIESILGVVYLEFGYHISMKVGNELKVTFPWDETDVSVACGEHGEIDNSLLLDVVKMCTGHNKAFNRPKLVDEAFTHPSAIDATVPSYQRLEWIGDAVLCLCAREWLFKNISGVTLGDLVLLEGALVSNETLAFVSMKYGLQHYLNHREKFLPKRIESYCWSVKEGCGLWGGDPPKPIADIVESILGSIHVDAGFESGQAATLHMMSSVLSVFKQSLTAKESGFDSFLRVMKHPKKSLQEMTGQLLEVMVCMEHEFASSFIEEEENIVSATMSSAVIPQILHKNEWRNPVPSGDGGDGVDTSYVSFVSILGSPIIAVADESITVARNKASSLVREAIERQSELEKRMASCRSKVESGLTFALRNQRRNQQQLEKERKRKKSN